MKVTMELCKETKNTFVYKTDQEGAAVTQLYVQKGAMPTKGDTPKTITVTVEAA
jgi:hypothetical protein